MIFYQFYLSFLQHLHITNYLSLFPTTHTYHQSSVSFLQHIDITNYLSLFEYIYHHYISLSIIHLYQHILLTHHLSFATHNNHTSSLLQARIHTTDFFSLFLQLKHTTYLLSLSLPQHKHTLYIFYHIKIAVIFFLSSTTYTYYLYFLFLSNNITYNISSLFLTT